METSACANSNVGTEDASGLERFYRFTGNTRVTLQPRQTRDSRKLVYSYHFIFFAIYYCYLLRASVKLFIHPEPEEFDAQRKLFVPTRKAI